MLRCLEALEFPGWHRIVLSVPLVHGRVFQVALGRIVRATTHSVVVARPIGAVVSEYGTAASGSTWEFLLGIVPTVVTSGFRTLLACDFVVLLGAHIGQEGAPARQPKSADE